MVDFVANLGTVGEIFTKIADVIMHPSKLLWWRKLKKIEPDPVPPEEIVETEKELDDIIAKITPTKSELRKMSKLELEIVANAHGIIFTKKRITKKEMISTIIKDLLNHF